MEFRRVLFLSNRWWYESHQVMSDTFKRCRVNSCSVATDEDFVTALMGLFRRKL